MKDNAPVAPEERTITKPEHHVKEQYRNNEHEKVGEMQGNPILPNMELLEENFVNRLLISTGSYFTLRFIIAVFHKCHNTILLPTDSLAAPWS